MKRVRALWTEYGGAIVAMGFAALFTAGLAVLIYASTMADTQQCADILSSARTARDSMDAKIACAQLRAETQRTIAIGVAAGTAAAAMSSQSSSQVPR